MPPIERKPHLLVRSATTAPYKYPKKVRGGPKLKIPFRDRASHGAKLQHDLENVRTRLADLDEERAAVGIQGDRGIYLEVASATGFDLAFKSPDQQDRSNAQRHVELVAVREQAETTLAPPLRGPLR